jgi:hypothetical protein
MSLLFLLTVSTDQHGSSILGQPKVLIWFIGGFLSIFDQMDHLADAFRQSMGALGSIAQVAPDIKKLENHF